MSLWGDSSLQLDKVYNYISGKVDRCYQACELQTHDIVTSSSSFPSRNVFPSSPSFCLVVKKIQERVCKVIAKTQRQLEGI